MFGVGLCLSKCTAGTLIWWKTISKSLTSNFQSRHAEVTIVQATAPALDSNDTVKDFCKLLPDTINEVPRNDIKIMLGDFNAQIHGNRIGMESYNWLPWVCKHKLSLYERLIFCNVNNLWVSNIFYFYKFLSPLYESFGLIDPKVTLTQRVLCSIPGHRWRNKNVECYQGN